MAKTSHLNRVSPTRECFMHVLKDFAAASASGENSAAQLAGGLRDLLRQYSAFRERANSVERVKWAADLTRLRGLLQNYKEMEERFRREQEHVADDFNLLDVMRLTGKEVRHTMLLAWLLDHDLSKLGTHAQGNLGFRLFLSEFLDLGLQAKYADSKYWVRREVSGDESIVDLEVACRGCFLVHIENKIWSCEGTDQTDREWSDLQRRAADLNVAKPEIHALFLTPRGTQPANPNFRAVSWGRIARVVEAFAASAKPPDVKLFAFHYAKALRRFIVTENEVEDEHAQKPHERS